MLDELKRQRQRVLERRDQCRNLISSIRRVPTETWSQIFSLACHVDDPSDVQNPVTQIAGVCKQWRDISVDSPALWASFLVDAREGHLTTEAFGQAHLSRSKPLPLQIRVRFPSDKEGCDRCMKYGDLSLHKYLPTACAIELFAWLLDSSDRWSQLRFSGTEVAIADWLRFLVRLNNFKHCSFSNLQSLDLGSVGRYMDFGEEFDLDFFSRADNLQNLSLYSYDGDRVPSKWTRLKNVTLTNVHPTAIHHLLEISRSSVTVADIDPLSVNATGPLAPQILTSLEKLEFVVNSPGSIVLFDALTLPRLQSLIITRELESNKLLQLVTRSSFPLETLELRNMTMYDQDDDVIWERCLSNIPDLSSFTFHGSSFSNRILRRLAISGSNDQPLLPQLAYFELACLHEQLDMLMTVLESRYRVSPLHEAFIIVRGSKLLSDKTLTRARALREAGLLIEIHERSMYWNR
ncbi:hypothetical protein C8J56DRAFT_837783 [Mycena floridula]|nr:hypothetical protein C8J56DRAFT_837783 [Mycena floridula]